MQHTIPRSRPLIRPHTYEGKDENEYHAPSSSSYQEVRTRFILVDRGLLMILLHSSEGARPRRRRREDRLIETLVYVQHIPKSCGIIVEVSTKKFRNFSFLFSYLFMSLSLARERELERRAPSYAIGTIHIIIRPSILHFVFSLSLMKTARA